MPQNNAAIRMLSAVTGNVTTVAGGSVGFIEGFATVASFNGLVVSIIVSGGVG